MVRCIKIALRIYSVYIDPVQVMAWTKASAVASSSSYPPRLCRTKAQLQEAQEFDSNPDYEMEEAKEEAGEESVVEEPAAQDSDATDEGSTDTDSNNDRLDYDNTHYRVAKAERRYNAFYHTHNIIVERGKNVPDVGNLTPRVRDALYAHEWLLMMEDRRPA